MKSVVDVATMRALDEATILGGVPAKVLMERAGKALFESHAWRGPVAVVCGSGNNAGDGYALAVLLREHGIPCRLIRLDARFSPDGEYFYRRAMALGVEDVLYTPSVSFEQDVEIADCIFGVGFRGTVTGAAKQVIEKINAAGKFVVSADINSGLNGDNGMGRDCVHSNLTVAIQHYKAGHFLGDAKDVIGALRRADIGILSPKRPMGVVEAEDFRSLLPPRKHNGHKGNYGYVTILGGCVAYSGAAKLANLSCAALRSGCGVAKLMVPASLRDAVLPYLLESTFAPMPEENGEVLYDAHFLQEQLAGQRAVAVGMGWGRAPAHEKILRHLLTDESCALLIDADGLNTLSAMEDGEKLLSQNKGRVLLTPHVKEFERISGFSVADILEHPIERAKEYAKRSGACVLLKGACTVVTDGDEVLLMDRGCGGMSTAGSGDVLSGVLVGLLGFLPLCPMTAALGAYLAGRAGELAQAEKGAFGMLASDTVTKLPAALLEIEQA